MLTSQTVGRSPSRSITAPASAMLDLFCALAAGLFAFQLRFDPALPAHSYKVFGVATQASPATFESVSLLFALCVLFFSSLFGLYQADARLSGFREQKLVMEVVPCAGLLCCGVLYLARLYSISRFVVIFAVLATTLLMMLRRWIGLYLRRRRYAQGLEVRNVLIMGTGRVAHALRNHLDAMPQKGYRFLGFVSTNDGALEEETVASLENCIDVARSLFVDEIYVSEHLDKQVLLPIFDGARLAKIDLRIVPDVFDGLAWNAPVDYVGQFATISLMRHRSLREAFLVKRFLDVALASCVLLLLSPVMACIAVLIMLDTRGPVLYAAKRIGRKGRLFRCYKFRTMVPNADRLLTDLAHRNERNDILFKIQADPRITKVGAKLRKYSLDELPQLFNVIKGDMSLVGPRPPLASEVDKYSLDHLRRLDVLPGITGLWQIEARQDPSFDSYIHFDTKYIENWSLWLDIQILLRTADVVFRGTGA